jgi:dissimilatory sulfite reductase related protein
MSVQTLSILDNLAFNDEGYMTDRTQWTEEVANAIAEDEDITLTERHWVVINFARSIFAETNDSPTLRQITKQTDVSMKEMYQLFPNGPAKKAAMIAGLPKPTGCI